MVSQPLQPLDRPLEPRCSECRDRGWITRVDEYGEKLARRCACMGRGHVDSFDQASIPARYRGCTLDGFHTRADTERATQALAGAKSRCQRYVDTFLELEGGFREAGLLFVGSPGTGKTHLAVSVLRELVESYGVRGLFVDFGTLVEEIQASFDPRNQATKHSVLEPVQSCEVLVLDELGVRKPTPFVSDVLYAVINERYKSRLPTLFTTNFALGSGHRPPENLDRGRDPEGHRVEALSLEERIPRMLFSRLFEMASIISMAGATDYRREVRAHGNVL